MSSLDDVTLLDESVPANVDIGSYKLVKGYSGQLGLPVEAFLRLYAVENGRIVLLIAGPEDLSKVVRAVWTLPQATSFVDIFTSPATHFLFPTYKDTVELAVHDLLGVYPGTISKPVFSRLGLKWPNAQEEPDQFLTQRNLLKRSEDGGCYVIDIVEAITKNGRYMRMSETVAGFLKASEVTFPTYE